MQRSASLTSGKQLVEMLKILQSWKQMLFIKRRTFKESPVIPIIRTRQRGATSVELQHVTDINMH